MTKQAGYTVAELLVAVATLVLLATLGGVSGSTLLNSVRVSKEAARLADSVALARQTAIARYEHWMVEFPVPAAGSAVVNSYTIKSCSLLDVSLRSKGCNPANPADWTIVPKGTRMAEAGVLLEILSPRPSPPAVIQVIYDRFGRYTASIDVEIKICALATDAGGLMKCRPGGPSKTIRVRKSSGIIQSLS